jgi:hypothetical protein
VLIVKGLAQTNNDSLNEIKEELSTHKKILRDIFQARSATAEVWFTRVVLLLFLVIVLVKMLTV